MDYAIEAEQVSKSFGDVSAIRNFTLGIPSQEIFCLLGPSGSGKTTAIRMMLGVYVPDAGRLSVLGEDPIALGATRYERIGYMPQLFVLYPTLTINENLNFVGQLYGLSLRDRRRRIREVLDFLQLWEHRGKTANNISGGMQRRLMLAASLLHQPDLLFMDEPTAGLDPILRTRLWKEFRRLNEAGTTLVVTTQYVSEAEYCDTVAILSDGELAAVGSPDELRQRALGGEIIEVHVPNGVTRSVVETLEADDRVISVDSTRYDQLQLCVTNASTAMPAVMNLLQTNNVDVAEIDDVDLPFDEVFVRLVEQFRADRDGRAVASSPLSANSLRGQ